MLKRAVTPRLERVSFPLLRALTRRLVVPGLVDENPVICEGKRCIGDVVERFEQPLHEARLPDVIIVENPGDRRLRLSQRALMGAGWAKSRVVAQIAHTRIVCVADDLLHCVASAVIYNHDLEVSFALGKG
jgi:hypothetical protein